MQEDLLRKHGYHIVGGHSAVKPCLWLGKSLRGEGGCYKSKFYGIKSHRCMQLTPVLDCTHRCLHCWRPFEVSLSCDNWDSPSDIVNGCLHEQSRLVSGYGGMDSVDRVLWSEAREPAHAAISLAGEPTLYPHLRELVDELMSHSITTFVVSNGTNPQAIRDIRPTQLYISINAPSREIYTKACVPVTDGWDNIMESLGYLARSASRTAVRITLVRSLNMIDP
ncbi:MAG TPA: 4-demethylwyosine synthase TYW1, partial [Candidatus Methanoperedenaceae archaeon]|nr:4-demethylwyosine synthase TYW1 [Candidatus Methanoperedenaceae archaeon]